MYGFRFYDRCLTPEEVANNSAAEERNYRSGNYFDPEVEYDGQGEVIGGEDGITYVNNIVTLTESTDLVPAIGEYGCENVHNLHCYGEDYQGIKIMPTTNDDGTITDMDDYKNPHLSPEERARDLLSRMTLDEKIAQVNIIRGSEFHVESARIDSCTVEADDTFMQDKFIEWMGTQGIGYIHDIYSIPAIKNRLQKYLLIFL